MAKDKEKKVARIQYIDQGKTAREVALNVGVSEKTLSNWINKDGWRALREAKAMSFNNDFDNIKKAISQIAEDRLITGELIKLAVKEGEKDEEQRLRGIAIGQADQVAKLNKSLENLNKDNKVTLKTYLDVMDSIFKSMQATHPDLYMKSLDFQHIHINEIAVKLG